MEAPLRPNIKTDYSPSVLALKEPSWPNLECLYLCLGVRLASQNASYPASQVKGIIYSPDYNFISGNTKESSKARRRQASNASAPLPEPLTYHHPATTTLLWCGCNDWVVRSGCASPQSELIDWRSGVLGTCPALSCPGKAWSFACPNKLAGWLVGWLVDRNQLFPLL